jgi:hypothetical protein
MTDQEESAETMRERRTDHALSLRRDERGEVDRKQLKIAQPEEQYVLFTFLKL